MDDKTGKDRKVANSARQWISGQPLIEILGDHRLLIERHRGVLAYDTEQIMIKVRFGEITVHGCDLLLAKMSQEQLVVTGKIQGVAICRRCADGEN